jgi:hypothetical protein
VVFFDVLTSVYAGEAAAAVAAAVAAAAAAAALALAPWAARQQVGSCWAS